MELTDVVTPSVLLSETHFPVRTGKSVFARAVERVAEHGYFRHVEITDVGDAADRCRIGGVIAQSGVTLTQWLTLLLHESNLSLSDADDTLRREAVQCVLARIEPALECGATVVAVGSGPDPGPDLRQHALAQLERSLDAICDRALAFPDLLIGLEPLDRGAHKNGLLGPTPESVRVLNRVRASRSNMVLCWDSAHVMLCGEDMLASLRQAAPLVRQVHFANAVLDRTQPGFGDLHMAPGPPGFLDLAMIGRLLRIMYSEALFGCRKPSVALEVRTTAGMEPWSNVVQCAAWLRDAWALAMREEDSA